MPSEELQLLIAGYVLGDLDSTEAAEFEQLLATDPTIAAEVTQMQAALELSCNTPELAPPAHLRAAILEAIDTPKGIRSLDADLPIQSDSSLPAASPTPEAISRITSRPASRPFSWSRTWGAAAAVLIVALGISNYRLWQTLQATQTIQTANTLTYTLQGTDPNSTASATLVVNPDTLEAALTVNNLPPPPPGKAYVLWTVLKPDAPFTADRKNAVLTEVLSPSTQGRVAETIAVPDLYRSSQYIAKVAVTLEDAAAPQAHAGTPILVTGSS